ncbi:MAG: response regulator [Polyangiaceae bacterium]|nr:response regulator [Polyangiaceae bacterium]
MDGSDGRVRVLVVDDEPMIGRSLLRAFVDLEVTVLLSVEAAIEQLDAGLEVDVILSDICLPGECGVDLYEWLVAHQPALSERMLFMTGSPTHPLALRARRTPVRILEKPFSAELALAEIMRLAPQGRSNSA